MMIYCRRCGIIIASLMMMLFLNAWVAADPVKIFCDGATRPTEFVDERGQLTGLTVDVVRELQKRVGNTRKIKNEPWARIYMYAQEYPNIMIFTASRNADREDKFHWVIHITTRRTVLFAKRGSALQIKTLDDAKQVGSIGVLNGGNREKYLKEQGFTNLDSVKSHERNLRKLLAGRVDLIFMSTLEAASLAKEVGITFEKLEPKYTVFSNDSYVILSKNGTASETVTRWTTAAREMKADGTFARIGEKWVTYIRENYGMETEVRDNVFYFWKE